jgi:hypothetical protein
MRLEQLLTCGNLYGMTLRESVYSGMLVQRRVPTGARGPLAAI